MKIWIFFILELNDYNSHNSYNSDNSYNNNNSYNSYNSGKIDNDKI